MALTLSKTRGWDVTHPTIVLGSCLHGKGGRSKLEVRIFPKSITCSKHFPVNLNELRI